MDPEETKHIEDLRAGGMDIRAIARKTGRDVKTIRRVLGRSAAPPRAPKIAKYETQALERYDQGLTVTRILRELRDLGYTGRRTILQDFLRERRGRRRPPPRVHRRFETPPAAECQVDWSAFRIPIAGIERLVHCFSMILAFSRMLFVAFYRNERLPTLLEAHVDAYAYFQGLCHRHVYDNMGCVCVGRARGKPIWNPTFLEFSKHYGFQPFVCRVRDPNRKGKIERPYPYIFSDFLKGSVFGSWDELNVRARRWLDAVANVRVHSTTHRRPIDMFAEEKDLLIQLPPSPYPTGQLLVRQVQLDGYVPVDGSFYPVPDAVPGRQVKILSYPHRVEILDSEGKVAAAYAVPEGPTRIFADRPAAPSRPEPLSLSALETRFLASFPEAMDFLDGLKLRMKSLAPIHLRRIEKLVGIYGSDRVRAAIARAQSYRNYNALALVRILEAAHPDVVAEPPQRSLTLGAAALDALDDVETGSPEDYDIDSVPPTEGDSNEEA
jgi:transposase